MKINLNDLNRQYKHLKLDINRNINTVLEHQKFIFGPENQILENKLSKYVKSKYCLSVSSGTDALLISLMALGIQPNDEVITTCFTFVSTAEVIDQIGAKPIFVDIDPNSCNFDIDNIEKNITNKTKAILFVNLFGLPIDYKKLKKIAEANKLFLIEDAAQSFGSKYYNKFSCNLGDISCTSFFPSKPLGCYGDGGAIFTNNKLIYELCKKIRSHGQDKPYNYVTRGIQGRMDTIQCAIVLSKLKIFKKEIENRRKIANFYIKLIKYELKIRNIKYYQSPGNPIKYCTYLINHNKFIKSAHAQFPIFTEERDKLRKFLENKGIKTAIYYPKPLSEQKIFKKIKQNKMSKAILISKKILSLPMSPYLETKEQQYVVRNIFKFFDEKN